MADDFTIANGDARVKIEGLGKLIRKLSAAGVASQDLKDLMHSIGMLVVNDANPPRRSGSLAGTLRAGKGKTKAVVRAGGAKVPYAGVIHYGWPARGIKPNPFIIEALQRQRGNALGKMEQGIQELLRKNDLT